MKTIIRKETPADYREVENLIRESFWNVYRPGCLEHFVIHQLRDDPAFVKELDFVMELDGRIIGQNMFMHAQIQADDGRSIPIMTMGPICIANDLKRQGYGKQLLSFCLEQAAALGCDQKLTVINGNGGMDQVSVDGFTHHSAFFKGHAHIIQLGAAGKFPFYRKHLMDSRAATLIGQVGLAQPGITGEQETALTVHSVPAAATGDRTAIHTERACRGHEQIGTCVGANTVSDSAAIHIKYAVDTGNAAVSGFLPLCLFIGQRTIIQIQSTAAANQHSTGNPVGRSCSSGDTTANDRTATLDAQSATL